MAALIRHLSRKEAQTRLAVPGAGPNQPPRKRRPHTETARLRISARAITSHLSAREFQGRTYSAPVDWVNAVQWFIKRITSDLCTEPTAQLFDAARTAISHWVSSGPIRADGSPRFTNWRAARRALYYRCRVVTPFRPHGQTLTVFRPPASLWKAVTNACRAKLTSAPCGPIASTAAKASPPTPDLAQITAKAFAVIVAERYAMLTANWSKDRQPLVSAIETAVHAWVKVRALRLRSTHLWQALRARQERAEASGLYAYTLWPQSLTNAARRACELHTFAVRQSLHVHNVQHVTA